MCACAFGGVLVSSVFIVSHISPVNVLISASSRFTESYVLWMHVKSGLI